MHGCSLETDKRERGLMMWPGYGAPTCCVTPLSRGLIRYETKHVQSRCTDDLYLDRPISYGVMNRNLKTNGTVVQRYLVVSEVNSPVSHDCGDGNAPRSIVERARHSAYFLLIRWNHSKRKQR